MYTKLFSSITDSTIWREPDHVRIVWITMLAKCDKNGMVYASIPGLSDASRVSLELTIEALNRLESPDKWSRSHEEEGRRILTIDGGWHLINHQKYKKITNADERKEYIRQKVKEYRTRSKSVNNVNKSKQCKHIRSDQIRSDQIKEEDSPKGSSFALKLPIESKEVVIPETLLTDEFVQWWNSWLIYRKKKKKSGDWRLLFRMQLEALEKMRVSQAIESLKTAIAKGWLDPYESKNKSGPQGKIRSASEYNEALKEQGLI